MSLDSRQDGGPAIRAGLIGLGLMGEPISKNLLAAGLALTCFDLNPAALKSAAAAGASIARSPADVARQSDVSVVIVPTNEDCRQVCLAPDGLLGGSEPGKIIVLCSSLTPETCSEIAAAAGKVGVGVLDAPMTGGIRGAKEAKLTLLVGGDEATLERARPVLQAISRSIRHLGPVGSGQVGKTVNNLIHWGEIVVITEALRLGVKLGVPASKLRTALLDAGVDSRTLRELHEMRFTWHAKDMADAFELATAVGHDLPAAAVARQEMLAITPQKVASLLSDQDWPLP